MVRTAIAQSREIRFHYTKWDGERSTRSVLPTELRQVGRSLCVRGWCNLRNAERTFAIKRMRAVRFDDS